MNQQTNKNQISKTDRNRRLILRTASLWIIALAFTGFAMQAEAQTVTSTVTAFACCKEQTVKAKVAVFDAITGRQIANGITYQALNTEETFAFASAPGEELVVVAFTANGYIGSARGMAGDAIVVFALQAVATMPKVDTDKNGNTPLTYTDDSGVPVKKANVAVVEWGTFGNARRGRTDKQGQYNFNDPKDLQGSDFLAVEWNASGAINLTVVLNHDMNKGAGAGSGWPAF